MNPIGNRRFDGTGSLGGLAWLYCGLHTIKVAQQVAQSQISNRISSQVVHN
jgi:hypothetical protein